MTIVNALKKLVTAWGGSTTADTIAEAIDDLSAVTPSSLPEVSSTDNGDILKVVSGEWAKATPSTELPVVSATDNGDVLTVVEGAWAKAAPSGGGSNVLVVNYTATVEEDNITITGSDKTYAEIYQAYQGGAYIIANLLGSFIPCVGVIGTEVNYQATSAQITSEDVIVNTLEIQHTSEDTYAAWIHAAEVAVVSQ